MFILLSGLKVNQLTNSFHGYALSPSTITALGPLVATQARLNCAHRKLFLFVVMQRNVTVIETVLVINVAAVFDLALRLSVIPVSSRPCFVVLCATNGFRVIDTVLVNGFPAMLVPTLPLLNCRAWVEKAVVFFEVSALSNFLPLVLPTLDAESLGLMELSFTNVGAFIAMPARSCKDNAHVNSYDATMPLKGTLVYQMPIKNNRC